MDDRKVMSTIFYTQVVNERSWCIKRIWIDEFSVHDKILE